MVPDLRYASQLEYMRTLTKPGTLSVNDFRRDFIALNDMAALFPDANGGTGLPDEEIKRAFFGAMPKSWRTSFEAAGYREHTSTLENIADYMKIMEQQHPFEARPARTTTSNAGNNSATNASGNGAHQLSRRNRNNNSRGNRNNGNGRARNQNNSQANSGNASNNTGNRAPSIRPNDTCPLPNHQNHVWYECRLNSRGRHGDDSDRPSNSNSNANGTGNNQGRRFNRGQSNTIEAAEAHYIHNTSNSVHFSSSEDEDVEETEAYCIECFSDTDDSSDDESVHPLVHREEADSDDESEGSDDEDTSIEDSDDNESEDSMPALVPRPSDNLIDHNEFLYEETYIPDEYTAAVRSGPFALSGTAFLEFEAQAMFTSGVDAVFEEAPSPPVFPVRTASATMVPMTIAATKAVNGVPFIKKHIRTLIDHGASHTIINRRMLPKNAPMSKAKTLSFSTTAGSFKTSAHVNLQDFRLPEFNMTRTVKEVKCYVFDNRSVPYDLILGRDFLNQVGIDVRSSTLSCEWLGDSIPFKPGKFLTNYKEYAAITDPPAVKKVEVNATTFTPTKSTVADIDEVCQDQEHLTPKQRAELNEILSKHTELFSGKLGRYPHRKFHIDLKPGTKPYHCKRPYAIPTSQRETVKEELDRQVKIGVLERVYESLWGMPMLCIPKKDGAIRTVDDMRELNKCIQRRVYPLPRLMDMLQRHSGWQYITVLDLTLCYYTYELDDESSWMCVLVTPFGKYRRLRLSMGLSQSPDWAQAAIEEALEDMLHEFLEAFIDDVAVFSKTWEEHLQHLTRVLQRLEANGYTVNPAKCKWAVDNVEWMGHHVTRDGLKPWQPKIQGILDIAPPKTLKQLRAFIGCVNFYRDFWKKRAHIMAPLTALTKVPRKDFAKHWDATAMRAFKATKQMVARDILLAYPDHNKPFVIKTDASDYQLGAVILQDQKPVAMFSRKLNAAQQRYATPDKEAVCIIEVLNNFRDMLYGAHITIETDHRNLAQANFTSQRLLKWRLAVEEFTPNIVYKPGEDNHVADGLSRLPLISEEEQTDHAPDESQDLLHQVLVYYPEAVDHFPLDFPSLVQSQLNDPSIQEKLQAGAYQTTNFSGFDLATKLINNDPRIVVPEALHDAAVHWYHVILGHVGQERLTQTLQAHLHFPGLKDKVKSFVETCDDCQRYKNNNRGYGHLPPRDDYGAPFEEVLLDHVGPWTIDVPDLGRLTFHALTIMDAASALIELVRVDALDGEATSLAFENTWLARYPRPTRAVYDAAGCFHGPAFQLTLTRESITPVPITVKNPQSNAIVERAHLTIGDMLRSFQSTNTPDNVGSAIELVDTILASAQRAMRSSIHKSMGISPGAAVFGRDMLLNLPVVVHFDRINQRRQAIADRNNALENRRRRHKNYNIGDEVLILAHNPTKMGARANGPFTITQVHVNGTVTIQRRPNVFERINIRRLKPYIRRV